MADETISTRIVANADFSALIADVHKVTASLSKLQEQLANSNKMLANQIAVMNRSFSDTLRSTGQFSTHFVSLQSDVEKFGKNLDGGKLKLNQYFNTFRDHARTSGGLIRDLAKQQTTLQNAILQPLGRNAQGLMQFNVQVPRGLDEVKNKAAIARQELQIMNKVIQDGAGQLINWGKNTQWAGRQLTVGLTVPLAAFGKAAADAFRQADQELVRLTKVYGDVAGTSAAELGKVRQEVAATAKELSSAMGVNFKETIGLAADIAATGKTGDELLGSIQETTRLAVLGEVDRQEAMKATLAIQSAFKQNTEELSESINFLNAVENQTSTTLNDLVEAIPKAGPVIQGLGGSVQDLALYLTAMREGGINASEGANALKSALASLINPTDVAVDKFKTLGIDLLGIVNNNAGNVTGTLLALQGALDNLDPLKKQQAIEQLFGKFQFARLNALFENLGRQGSQTLQVMDLMKASSEDLAAVAGRELSAVTESASGKYRRALEGLKASLAEVGEQFLTINTTLIQVIEKVISFATNLPKPVKQVLALLGGITAVIGPFIMLTGVLANFFGYVLKGVGHMKAFFKGGEGWKYLTPEMLAAEKAGKLVEQSFYSDAKAAAVLKQALGNLIDEFSVLEAKAKSGALSVNPAVTTMAGNLVAGAGGQRIVNPQHPLAGGMGTRASSHMVPRAGMTEEQRLSQTMFGMVPGAGPVNQKIGQNPQIYMNDALPNVPGLTSIGGVSTGVVSGEAARWHAMMATLGMQSKAEIEALKKQIVATGVVSKDFMSQFDDILPVVSKLTDNAARESALIVAELRAGKLTVEAAKAKIVALNLETERMIASAVGTQASAMGRTINPTMVPTLNQPVVDAAGKSNMRELFKKGNTRDFINKVAGALGVRTSGAGYNIETTMPRKMNSGGYVYSMNDGNIVPGPNVNADVVPAMLTPGEFVVNRESAQRNLPLLMAINGSPREAGRNNRLGGFMSSNAASAVLRTFGVSSRSSKPSRLLGNWGMLLPNAINRRLFYGRATGAELRQHVSNRRNLIDVERFLAFKGVAKKDIDAVQARISKNMSSKIVDDKEYSDSEFGALAFSSISPEIKALESRYPGISLAYQKDRMQPGRRDTASSSSRHGPSPTGVNVPGGRGSSYGSGSGGNVWAHFADSEFDQNISALASGYNAGGMIPGYNKGGMIPGYRSGGMIPGMSYYNRGTGARGAMREGYANRRAMAGQGSTGSPTGGMGSFMGGMALQMGGNMVGGTAGQIMSLAGMGMQMLPMIGMLGKAATGVTKLSGGFRMLGSVGGTAINILSKIKMINPMFIAATAAITGLIYLFKRWRKEIEETRREQTNTFGLTEKGAKEAGIQYTSLTDKVKALREEQKLAADKTKAYFESYTSSGVRGLTLTIQQLKELKTRVKTDMPDLVSTFNSIDTTKVNDLASNLKAQMVAGGKSVEDATNLIYALVEASNKAGQGVTAISNKAFSGITDKGAAASFIMKNLAKNIEDVSKIDAAAFASNVDNAVASLDSAVKSLVGTKNAAGETITEAQAIAEQFQKMTDAGIKNKKLGDDALKALKSQRPEFAAILTKSETIGGMYAKWRLLLQGVAIDLSKISSAQAETLSTFMSGLDAAGAAALKVGGGVKGLEEASGLLKELDAEYKKAAKAGNANAVAAAGLSKKQIKAIQDEIKAIRDRAEAKKKALRETFDRENAELELQQAKLDLQSAVARGDKDAAAAAQLRIQQIQKEASLKAAEAAIDKAAAKEEAKQQGLLDKDQAYKDTLTDAINSSQNKADKIAATIKTITDLGNEITNVAKLQAVANAPGATEDQKKQFTMSFSNWLNDVAKSAKADPKVLEAYGQFLAKDAKGAFSKDAKGNYIPLSMNEATTVKLKRSGTEVNIPEGEALTQLNQLSKSMTDFASKIIGKGGKTLSDVYNILAEANGKKTSQNVAVEAKDLNAIIAKRGLTNEPKFKTSGEGKGDLEDTMRQAIIKEYGLAKDDTFEFLNVKYRVTGTGVLNTGASRVTPRKAMGGYVSRAANGVSGMNGSQPYLVGERGPELFVPSSGGQIIPNNILGAKYNIPSNTISGVSSGANNSYNNNTYNIGIELNGTNVTADDIIRKFKSELALMNAKEGRSRSLGGNY
jgi:TP901 family phage tail tape measure protein